MECFKCKSAIEYKNTVFSVKIDNQTIQIENVPSHVCSQCGEVSYSDNVAKQIEKIVNNFKQEIIVVDYEEVKDKPRTFAELMEGYEEDTEEYEYREWDTGRPVGREDIYNNPEYMERLMKAKKEIEEGKYKIKELIGEE